MQSRLLVRHRELRWLSLPLLGAYFVTFVGCSAPGSVRTERQLVADYTDELGWSPSPPDQLDPVDVPQFVAVTFDDNFVADGMHWATDFLLNLENPAGSGFAPTFDGEPVRTSFYFNSTYLWSEENKQAWVYAVSDGHEAANHTINHPNGQQNDFTIDDWTGEIAGCTSDLTDSEGGIGVAATDIVGFRSPFLAYNENLFPTLQQQQLTYDTSIQTCWGDSEDGTNCAWPYTMNTGSPDADVLTAKFGQPTLGSSPGLWEVPLVALIVPPDEKAAEYGFDPGLRGRIPTDMGPPNFYDPTTGKLAPLDITLFVDAQMSGPEVLATLKYTLDLHLAGNRAPFVFVAHTHVYASDYGSAPNAPNAADRRGAIEDFVTYALSKDPVRMRPVRDIVAWMRDPEPLDGVRTVLPPATGGTGTGGGAATGGNGTGATGGTTTGAGGGPPDPAAGSEETPSSSTCACQTPGKPIETPRLEWLFLGVAAALLRRRQRA